MPEPEVSFEAFCENWLEEVRAGSPSTIELGRRFSQKLVAQWLDAGDTSVDLVYCDGAGDGGIDVAILDRGDEQGEESDSEAQGHTWYLVQSKYGRAFQGVDTLLHEGQKVIDTLDGRRPNLSSLAEGLLARITNFRAQASERDRITLVFATQQPLDEAQRRVLGDLRAMGRGRLGTIFDVEAISLETIHLRLREAAAEEARRRLTVPMVADLVPSGNDLLVGSVSLMELYRFLKAYRDATDDLDRLYEKNVRRFLGGRGKVNKAMLATLRDAPERFGLYNNGITIVVADYEPTDGAVKLIEPFVVNGCQTTKTIWEVFHQRLDAGGTGADPELDAWRDRATSGVVVTKVVKVGASGEALLQAITRYTNSQNAVRERDFLALTGDFRSWQQELASRWNLYLEIQRGGWDSQRAYQKQNPATKQFRDSANAADLVKVYGAGWLGEAGVAFGKNPPFLPNGSIFKRIVNVEGVEEGEPFGATDLYAAYLLQQVANKLDFGRGAAKATRRQTRFMFYMVIIDLLKDTMSRSNHSTAHRKVSAALISLNKPENAGAAGLLYDQAAEVIDSYFTQGTDDCVFDEPAFLNSFNSDLNGFLKWEKLGKDEASCPRLRSLLAINKAVMGRSSGGQAAPRQQIAAALSA